MKLIIWTFNSQVFKKLKSNVRSHHRGSRQLSTFDGHLDFLNS